MKILFFSLRVRPIWFWNRGFSLKLMSAHILKKKFSVQPLFMWPFLTFIFGKKSIGVADKLSYTNLFFYFVCNLFFEIMVLPQKEVTQIFYFYFCVQPLVCNLFLGDTGVWFWSIKEVAQRIIFSKCVRPLRILHKKEVAQTIIFSKCVQPLLYTIIWMIFDIIPGGGIFAVLTPESVILRRGDTMQRIYSNLTALRARLCRGSPLT